MDEIDYGEIARFLSNLSRRASLPQNVAAEPPTEFSPEDVSFDDNTWLARVAEVQVWLYLEDHLSFDEPETVIAGKLFTQLAPDSNQPQFVVLDGLVRMTDLGAQALETRLARADERSSRFIEAIEEGAPKKSASEDWAQEWEEPETREPPNIKATVATLPIVEFVSHAKEDELDLNPPYQREYIWSNPRLSKAHRIDP